MAQLAPFGFQAGQSRRSVNEYYVPASDTTTLAVGDPVKTNGNVFVGRLPDSRQSSGMLHVTKAASGNAVRGVIVGITAGPGDNSAQSIPATKQRAYTVLVNDNPQVLWDVQANNTVPLSAMAGMYASYAVGAPLGSVSSTVVDAGSIGSTVSDLLIAEVLRNDGANSLLRVAFVQHEMAAAGGSPQIGAQIQSLMSGAGITTWALRADVLTAGLTTAFFTDVGVGGSHWDYVGGRWRPSARQAIIKNLISSLSHNSSAKVVISEATLPAGLLQDGDVLVVDYLKTKEGGTSDTESTDVLLGATSGTLGTSLALTTSALATTTQQVASRYLYRRESATTIRPISITGPQGIGSSTGAPAGVITVPNMDSQATYLQISGDMTTGGGAETVWLRGFVVTLLAGA